MIDYAKWSDYDLVYFLQKENPDSFEFEAASRAILNRYEKQIHRNWHVLCRQMDYSDLVMEIKEEFYHDAYEAFFTAITKIDLSKVYDANWKLVGYSNFYITNVRTRLIKDIKRKSKVKSLTGVSTEYNEEIETVSPDIEEAYRVTEGYKNEPEYCVEQKDTEEYCKKMLKKCIEKWTPFEREIFALLKKQKTRAEIAEILNVPTIKVYQTASKMKDTLKKALEVY